jgi:hypothetical protein
MKQSKIPLAKAKSRKRNYRYALAAMGAVLIIGGAAFVWGIGLGGNKSANATEIEIYKSPYCGCCSQWAAHLEANGFRVSVRNINDLGPIKAANNVTPELAACHTAIVDGYVVEGHVPVDLIQRLLAERPDAIGIAVPGMPSSAPGMDMPTGEPYTVLIFDKDGRTGVYAER